jgi:hypothetical protein
MARKEVKYKLNEIIRKIQLGQQLTKDEEVYYLIEALGMKKKDAERTVYLGEHHEESGILRD